jgi:hypothetical protein
VQLQDQKQEAERVVLEGHRIDSCTTTNIAGGVWMKAAVGFQPRKHVLAIYILYQKVDRTFLIIALSPAASVFQNLISEAQKQKMDKPQLLEHLSVDVSFFSPHFEPSVWQVPVYLHITS